MQSSDMGRNGADFTGSKNPRFSHGLTDGGSYRHPVYTAWQNMKSRCFNPKNAKFHRYGGRGITVCEQWLSSVNFSQWAFDNGWAKGLSLDRVDNDGPYEPGNCHWTTIPKNSRKKSTTKLSYDKALDIRERVSNGERGANLAVEYGVAESTVAAVMRDFTWKDLK